jgi:hypothetical protein
MMQMSGSPEPRSVQAISMPVLSFALGMGFEMLVLDWQGGSAGMRLGLGGMDPRWHVLPAPAQPFTSGAMRRSQEKKASLCCGEGENSPRDGVALPLALPLG